MNKKDRVTIAVNVMSDKEAAERAARVAAEKAIPAFPCSNSRAMMQGVKRGEMVVILAGSKKRRPHHK